MMRLCYFQRHVFVLAASGKKRMVEIKKNEFENRSRAYIIISRAKYLIVQVDNNTETQNLHTYNGTFISLNYTSNITYHIAFRIEF